MTLEENTEKFKSRFQFLLTISMFFPIALEHLFKEGGSTEPEINKMILYWGLQVALLIIGYIFLECFKKWKSKLIFDLTNFLLFTNLGSFSVVLFIFASMQNTGALPMFYLYLFGTTFPVLLVIPSIILLLITINLLLPSNMNSWVYNKIKLSDMKFLLFSNK